MARRSPQEKKRLSYVKDRRNDYGESPKAARKSIPRRRRFAHRADRHRIRQALSQARGVPDETRADMVEQRYKARRTQRRKWRKYRDAPLGEIVAFQLRRRAERGGADPAETEDRIRRIRRRLS